MPEGDTIFRTASSMRTWMAGRVVTSAWCKRNVGIERIVNRAIVSVEAHGKNLLVTFASESDAAKNLVLKTHMLMTGSWHLYEAGAAWKRPKRQAAVIIEAGERIAVGFNVPIVELLSETMMRSTPALALLGPDILADAFSVTHVLARMAEQPSERALGEVLLDQRIVAGIGNIYRCEALFAQRVHPWTPLAALDEPARKNLVLVAQECMKANLNPRVIGRDFGAGAEDSQGIRAGSVSGGRAGSTFVYRRAGRPCRICRTAIESRPQGPQARRAYWCPTCQEVASSVVTSTP